MFRNINFGIVQGRLIQSPKGCLQWFPGEYWETEFFLASALRYNYIELIAERQHNENNPIWTDEGISKIVYLSKKNNLLLDVICNDYIIDHSIIEQKSVIKQTLKLIDRTKLMGIKKMILPFFGRSELNESNSDKYKQIIKEIANCAQENKLLICIETVLTGENLLRLMECLNHPNIKCVFDTGNRIAFGHDIYSDILLLREQICHVHIKDKNDQNENVLLGTGKVNFYKVFQSLFSIGYNGPYTFETYRGKDPIRTAKYNMLFAEMFIKEAVENEN